MSMKLSTRQVDGVTIVDCSGRITLGEGSVMMRDTDAGLAQVIRMASLTPAERTGFAADRGSLEVGKLADVVILSRDLHVQRTFINGSEFGF